MRLETCKAVCLGLGLLAGIEAFADILLDSDGPVPKIVYLENGQVNYRECSANSSQPLTRKCASRYPQPFSIAYADYSKHLNLLNGVPESEASLNTAEYSIQWHLRRRQRVLANRTASKNDLEDHEAQIFAKTLGLKVQGDTQILEYLAPERTRTLNSSHQRVTYLKVTKSFSKPVIWRSAGQSWKFQQGLNQTENNEFCSFPWRTPLKAEILEMFQGKNGEGKLGHKTEYWKVDDSGQIFFQDLTLEWPERSIPVWAIVNPGNPVSLNRVHIKKLPEGFPKGFDETANPMRESDFSKPTVSFCISDDDTDQTINTEENKNQKWYCTGFCKGYSFYLATGTESLVWSYDPVTRTERSYVFIDGPIPPGAERAYMHENFITGTALAASAGLFAWNARQALSKKCAAVYAATESKTIHAEGKSAEDYPTTRGEIAQGSVTCERGQKPRRVKFKPGWICRGYYQGHDSYFLARNNAKLIGSGDTEEAARQDSLSKLLAIEKDNAKYDLVCTQDGYALTQD